MFEVAQAAVRNWEQHSTDGIFLSFHLRAPSWVKQLKPSCKFLKRGRRTAKDPTSVDFEGKMRTTQVVKEDREMVFRAADMDSTTHLFMMTGPGWNVRRGDKVILVAEVYRRQMQAGKDIKLTKFRNEFIVGTVGEVILAETLAMAKRENLLVDRPHVVLEVRASWSQGFVLDNARPSFADAALLCLRRPVDSLGSRSSHGGGCPTPTGEESMDVVAEDPGNLSEVGSQASDDNSDQALEGLSSSDWIPSDWTSAWGSPWPGDDDKLDGKHPVVPLMEAEFKKDCIIMYNTLFPNVRSQIFMTLRDLALSNSQSRLAWRTYDGINREEAVAVGTQSVMRGSNDASITSEVELISPTSGKTPVPSIGLAPQDYPPDMPVQLSNLSTCVVERGATSRTASVLRQSQGRFDLTEVFDEYSVRSMFLKRLFICFAFCGVFYSAEGNAALCRELWPYPLASILTHGTRMLIQLIDVEGSEFMNYLFFGNPSQENPAGSVWPMNYRIAATHAVVYEDGHLVEKKLEAMKVSDSMQNIADGLNKKHMGLNLPIGGVGNPSPLGSQCFVGFTGDVVKVMKPLPRVSTVGVRTSRASRMVVDRLNTATTAGTSSGKTIDGRTLTGNLTYRETTDGEPEDAKKEAATESVDRRALLMPPDWSDSTMDQHRQLKEATTPKDTVQFSPRTMGEASDGYASIGNDSLDAPTPVRTRRNSFSTTTRLLTGTAGIDACGLGADYKVISGVQCGHLYCRMDNFGEYGGTQQFPSGLDCTGDLWRMLGTQDVSEAHLRLVRASVLVKSRPSVDALLATAPSAVIKPTDSQQTSSSSSSASILGFEFADKCPRPSSQNLRNMYEVWHTRRLSRVRSEPPRRRDTEDGPSHLEMKWLQTSLKMKPGSRLNWPPSESSLRLLLELFNPDYLRLFGVAKFGSISDLYQELSTHRRESLVKGHTGLMVVSERVMLKIRWKGHFLVCADEEQEKGRRPSALKSSKGDFITASSAVVKMQGHGKAARDKDAKRLIFPAFTLLQPESWQVGTSRWVQRHFAIAPSVFIKDSLSRGVTHSVNEEMLPTSTYPGLSMLRRTYIVTWDVQGRAAQHFQKYDFMHTGLLDEHMKSMQTKARLLGISFNKQHMEAVKDMEGCPFCTVPLSTGSDNSGFPETEDSLMRWLWRHHSNLQGNPVWMLLDEQEETLFSELPEAEVWAKSLLKKDGMLPVPPSEAALSVLLQLSLQGSRTQRQTKNGKGGKLRDLWMELLLQQSYLLMRKGHVYHVVEEVVIRIRGRHKQKVYTLVQETEKSLEDWHLPKTRKLKEETWREATSKWLTSRFTKVDPSLIAMEYAFVVDDGRSEVLTASMPKLLRWHLVTISIRDDLTRVPFLSNLQLDDKLCIGEKAKVPIEARLTRWMLDSETIGLRNAELFKRTPRRSTVSSVLIGLEGSGPNSKGAFNQKHSTTGQSGKVSAVGSRKWRAYRVNSALEVPAEFGSIRMTLDRATFKEFMDKCDSLNLRDPIEDLAGPEQRSCDRHSLWREHVEQEFFKLLLSSNGQEAKEALESILCEQLPSKRPGMHRSL